LINIAPWKGGPYTEIWLKRFDVQRKPILHQSLETEDTRWGYYHVAEVDVENSLFKPTGECCALTRACISKMTTNARRSLVCHVVRAQLLH
jgi:hypothetical protein